MKMKKLYLWINEDLNLIRESLLKNKKIILPIFSGVLFVLFFGRLNIIIVLLSIIAFIDYNTLYIPDILNYTLIILGILNTTFLNISIGIMLFLLLIQYAKKDKLGYGDVKLLFGLSLVYGINIFYIIIFSVIISLIFERKEKAPLGYYLFWGAIVENIWFFNFQPFTYF
ncbi:Type IV leader peptidase family protein [Marinitoga hydrogenitolerans DSM 16785]|uniref:Type IV leader peptidase family protein n=1 Tax=Marinitoga hydrogenitolerans (strain DSM 16785 / JCM 12826 / AT1271) TaxID=1122195 RepID=A0A1M4S619_MARH1|nr:prepilin peptidase [Marinitoga hydrogenitolerans]SHE27631.1 Type IV leader peptidase family protein [Marinitoga hydrogenitolerans DSM 16785]